MPPVTGLEGERLLLEHAGSWARVLDPSMADTTGVVAGADFQLEALDELVTFGLTELGARPLPEIIYHPEHPDDAHKRRQLASWLAGYRAERLCQWAEFAGNALHGIAVGSIQIAAVSARALLELAAGDNDIHQNLKAAWAFWESGGEAYDAPARDLAAQLWVRRYGTRNAAPDDTRSPASKNAMTGLKRLRGPEYGRLANELYANLCEATHPNIEGNGAYWRRGRTTHGIPVVEFAPARSESPIKASAIQAVTLSSVVLLELARDLRAASSAVALSAPAIDPTLASQLGLPGVPGRNEPCPCGSGEKFKRCGHPQGHPFMPSALSG